MELQILKRRASASRRKGLDCTRGVILAQGANGIRDQCDRLPRSQQAERRILDAVFGDYSIDYVLIGFQYFQ